MHPKDLRFLENLKKLNPDDYHSMRTYVKELDIKMQDLAEEVGVSHTQLYTYLNSNLEKERILRAIKRVAEKIGKSGDSEFKSQDLEVYRELLRAKDETIRILKDYNETLKKRVIELENSNGKETNNS